MATLREMQEFYSYRDALDLAEIIAVQNHNEDLLYRRERAKAGR